MERLTVGRWLVPMFVSFHLSHAAPSSAGEPAPAPITTAAAVLALPASVARAQAPVVIEGIVTAAEPDWDGKFFVQDATGGIFVSHAGAQPEIGDVVQIRGTSRAGSFAPVVDSPQLTKVGTAHLPAPKQVSIERLMAGAEDGQRVQITGLVRSVHVSTSGKLVVDVAVDRHRVHVFPKLPAQINPASLIAAQITVSGTAATGANPALRQLTSVNLYVPRADDFTIVRPERHSPFDQPVVPLGSIGRYRSITALEQRAHVKGVVTLQRVGQDLFIQDETGALRIETAQSRSLPPGKTIEAVGFLEIVNHLPVLKDSVVRQLPAEIKTVAPRRVPISQLRDGLHPAELITLRGRLIERSVRPVQREIVPFVGTRIVCTLQGPELTFTAEREQTDDASALTSIPLGSTVELSGVASLETGKDGKLNALTLLLPAAENISIIAKPGWFTAERLLAGLAAACVVLASVAGWSLAAAKKNTVLKVLAAEREQARKELQDARVFLEQKVQERTAQLKFELAVPGSGELEARAILAERTRLARELHDTIEQALTGIALQLDTASRLFQRSTAQAGQRLELARELLRQSQVELRRSIWDLRSRELDQFDLAEALKIASRQIVANGEVRVEFETTGERKRLHETVEECLLRIAQESLTNVIKHSGATLVTVHLSFSTEFVALEVKDNGSGLAAGKIAARENHHFGLLGMSERARRLGGRVDVSGLAGEGTTIRATIPLAMAPAKNDGYLA